MLGLRCEGCRAKVLGVEGLLFLGLLVPRKCPMTRTRFLQVTNTTISMDNSSSPEF